MAKSPLSKLLATDKKIFKFRGMMGGSPKNIDSFEYLDHKTYKKAWATKRNPKNKGRRVSKMIGEVI